MRSGYNAHMRSSKIQRIGYLIFLVSLALLSTGCAGQIARVGEQTLRMVILILSILGAVGFIIAGIMVMLSATSSASMDLAGALVGIGVFFIIMGAIVLAPGFVSEAFKTLSGDKSQLVVPPRHRP